MYLFSLKIPPDLKNAYDHLLRAPKGVVVITVAFLSVDAGSRTLHHHCTANDCTAWRSSKAWVAMPLFRTASSAILLAV